MSVNVCVSICVNMGRYGMIWGWLWDGMGWLRDGYGMVMGWLWDGMGWYGMVWDGMGWLGDVLGAGRPAPTRADPRRLHLC